MLLAGVGGDSHSVGLTILKWSLEANGYEVIYLGTQNPIKDIVLNSSFANYILISCMDGHAERYLRNLPDLRNQMNISDDKLWYLGGNPSLMKDGNVRHFKSLGFERVYSNYVNLKQIHEDMRIDEYKYSLKLPNILNLKNKKSEFYIEYPIFEADEYSREFLLKERNQILMHWKTGEAARDFDVNAGQHDFKKSLATLEITNREIGGSPLLQARTGVISPAAQHRILKRLISSGANVVSHQVDSLTRNSMYQEAERALQEYKRDKTVTINGTPIINWGVEVLRRISEDIPTPMQVRHSAKDPRLLAEVTFASGISGFEGGPICYNLPYYKDLALGESIQKWKYVDKLASTYFEKFGIVIHREFFGVLTGTLIPHSLGIATGILEGFLACQQGVQAISIGIGESGSLAQDVAAIKFIKEDVPKIFKSAGLNPIHIGATLSQHMGAFPSDPARAKDLIIGSAIAAAHSNPDRFITKTFVEAERIPTVEDNAEAMNLISSLMATKIGTVNLKEIDSEYNYLKMEVEDLLENVIFRGGGDISRGIQLAFKNGELDIPFSPSKYNLGKVFIFRDILGRLRYGNFGKMNFRREVRQFHEYQIQERLSYENLKIKRSYELVERDIRAIIEGKFESWPLDKEYVYFEK